MENSTEGDGHDDLLDSPEGRVFHAFHQQLGHSIELDNMKQRLRTILRHPATQSALTRAQQVELRAPRLWPAGSFLPCMSSGCIPCS